MMLFYHMIDVVLMLTVLWEWLNFPNHFYLLNNFSFAIFQAMFNDQFTRINLNSLCHKVTIFTSHFVSPLYFKNYDQFLHLWFSISFNVFSHVLLFCGNRLKCKSSELFIRLLIFIQAEFISELSTLKHISMAMLKKFPFHSWAWGSNNVYTMNLNFK